MRTGCIIFCNKHNFYLIEGVSVSACVLWQYYINIIRLSLGRLAALCIFVHLTDAILLFPPSHIFLPLQPQTMHSFHLGHRSFFAFLVTVHLAFKLKWAARGENKKSFRKLNVIKTFIWGCVCQEKVCDADADRYPSKCLSFCIFVAGMTLKTLWKKLTKWN